jgi:hypothetical protein
VEAERRKHANERDSCPGRQQLKKIQDSAYLSNATTCSVDYNASGRGKGRTWPDGRGLFRILQVNF